MWHLAFRGSTRLHGLGDRTARDSHRVSERKGFEAIGYILAAGGPRARWVLWDFHTIIHSFLMSILCVYRLGPSGDHRFAVAQRWLSCPDHTRRSSFDQADALPIAVCPNVVQGVLRTSPGRQAVDQWLVISHTQFGRQYSEKPIRPHRQNTHTTTTKQNGLWLIIGAFSVIINPLALSNKLWTEQNH